MEELINQKLDELFIILDNNGDIKKLMILKEKIGEEELLLIKNYRDNPTIEKKKELYNNTLLNDYLVCENNINYIIMLVNSKFKGDHSCESN